MRGKMCQDPTTSTLTLLRSGSLLCVRVMISMDLWRCTGIYKCNVKSFVNQESNNNYFG